MKITPTALVIMCLVLTGCQSTKPEYRTLVSDEHDISLLKRYSWARDKTLSVVGALIGANNSDLEARLKQDVSRVLKSKGYTLVNAGANPQFYVSFVLGTAGQINTATHEISGDRLYREPTVSYTMTTDYVRGGVSVVLRIPGVKDPVWQGTAIQTLKNRQMKKQDGGTLKQLVEIIMKPLPASAG